MNAIDRLAEIEARANAATEGPWEVEHEETYDHLNGFDNVWWVTAGGEMLTEESDAAFIAHARTDAPALVATLRAVLAEVEASRGTDGSLLGGYVQSPRLLHIIESALDGAS